VFCLHALDSPGQYDNINYKFIPTRDFKDYYFPKREHVIDTGKTKKDRERELELKRMAENSDDEGSQKSMMIDDIMQSRSINDIMAEKNKKEHHEM